MSSVKPEFIVFYAWQSDRPKGENRYFIQDAATEAADELNNDSLCPFFVRIDQDTQGVPGLCDIPATILGKIDAADAFLCDLTYVAESTPVEDADADFEPRLCSNPNVLFELGYAFRSMGCERILCVMNERYGPVAKQIFDLAHRRFPIAYRLPDDALSKKDVKKQLVKRLGDAIRHLFPLGKRADERSADRVPEIRRDFESRVRAGTFHQIVRRAGAITVAVIPGLGTRLNHEQLQQQHVPPLGKTSWNTEIRGKSVLSRFEVGGELCSVAELRDDGVVLSADTWVLDPSYHPCKDRIVPAEATERAIMTTASYLKMLRELHVPLPWTICISLLEVNDYWLFVSEGISSRRQFPEQDIAAEPIIVRDVKEISDRQGVARLLRPSIDYIWREFGFEGSPNYTGNGIYNVRF